MDEQRYRLQTIKEISNCFRWLDLYFQEANQSSQETLYCFKDWLLKQQYRQIREIREL